MARFSEVAREEQLWPEPGECDPRPGLRGCTRDWVAAAAATGGTRAEPRGLASTSREGSDGARRGD